MSTLEPDDGLYALVGDWDTLPDVAQRLGVPFGRVRRLVEERFLVALRIGQPAVWRVPSAFLTEEGPRPELRGTFTVLSDGGMDDAELVRWLFTPDPTLPGGGSPMAALDAGYKTEVRRRAMETAF